MRAQDFIVEAFDQPYPLTWEESLDGESYDALARLDDGTNLSIMFNLEYGGTGDEEWHVEFWRNHSLNVTGEGDAYRIFATVLTAIHKFIQVQKPWRLIFSASKDVESGQNPQSRSKLYDSLVARYARAWGYDSYNEDHGDQVTYELTRLQNEAADLDEMAGEIHGGVRKALMAKGYQYLGSGIDKQAYLEPGTGQVLIVFGYRKNIDDFSPDQRMFINWIKYCNQHQDNPHLPKFSGFESFQFQGKNYIQARMEPLRELPGNLRDVVSYIDYVLDKLNTGDIDAAIDYIADKGYYDEKTNKFIPYRVSQLVGILGGKEKTQNLLNTVHKVAMFGKEHGYNIDLHSGNYMQRADGTIVVNDPFVVWLQS